MRLHMQGSGARVDDAALRRFELDPDGPVRQMLEPIGQRVLVRMVVTSPKRTARLASTARRVRGVGLSGPYIDIQIGHPRLTGYLGYILFGTEPHIIRARQNRPNPHLRFIWRGQIHFRKSVRHPGTRANNFVVGALDAAR